MSHIPYTISRSGCYYYNRRVPKHAVEAYGNFIRVALSKCPQESEEYAKRLSYVLEGSWRDTTEIRPVDIISIVESYKPRKTKLLEIAEEYMVNQGSTKFTILVCFNWTHLEEYIFYHGAHKKSSLMIRHYLKFTQPIR